MLKKLAAGHQQLLSFLSHIIAFFFLANETKPRTLPSARNSLSLLYVLVPPAV